MNQTFSNMSSSGEGTVNNTDFISADGSQSLPAWSKITYLCVVSTITAIAIAGNGLILTVGYYNKKRTSTDWLVTFMAATDLATSVVDVSIAILYFSGYLVYIGSDTLCSVINSLRVYPQFLSSVLLTATGIDRYFKTCRPHSTTFSPRKAFHTCIGITLSSSLICIPVGFLTKYQAENRVCRISDTNEVLSIVGICLRASYIAMFASLILIYSKIGFVMKKRLKRDAQYRNNFEMTSGSTSTNTVDRQRSIRCISNGQLDIQSNNRDDALKKNTNRITVIMRALTAVFFVTWTLYFGLTSFFEDHQSFSNIENVVLLFVRILPLANTIANPIFFVTMSSKFRQQSKEVFRKVYQALMTCSAVE